MRDVEADAAMAKGCNTSHYLNAECTKVSWHHRNQDMRCGAPGGGWLRRTVSRSSSSPSTADLVQSKHDDALAMYKELGRIYRKMLVRDSTDVDGKL